MNFVFISPHFPESYWLFCQGLKNNGVNVLAITDTPYESLTTNLKNSINDFYKVTDLENYDEMHRAIAYLTFKHGKIDWIESNNEYWLRQDARLRRDFNVQNGMQYERMDEFQSKAAMKGFFSKATLATARYAMAETLEKAIDFIKLVGYPIVIKPNIGVGASDTHKIKNIEQLTKVFKKTITQPMIMEEYIDGETFSFDGITNSKKEILFVTSHQYTDSIMDSVNEQKTIGCYSYIDIPKDIMEAGTKTVQAFDTKCRFFHFEFFRLKHDKTPLGKKGDILGLEVNMRPPGGFLPDMINYANDSNVYQLWADMIVKDTITYKQHRKYSSGFIGRRDSITYKHTTSQIQVKYKANILMIKRLPKALAEGMGDEVIVARFPSEKEMKEFFHYASDFIKA